MLMLSDLNYCKKVTWKKKHYYGCSSSWNSHYQLCLNKWNSQSGVQGTRIQSGEPYHEIAIMGWHN